MLSPWIIWMNPTSSSCKNAPINVEFWADEMFRATVSKRFTVVWESSFLPYWGFIVNFPNPFNKFLAWLDNIDFYAIFLCPPDHVTRLLSNVAPPTVIVFYFKQANVIFAFYPSAWRIRDWAAPFSIKKSKNIHVSFS